MKRAGQTWVAMALGVLLVLGLTAVAHSLTVLAPLRGDDYQVLELARRGPWDSVGPAGLGVLAHASLWFSHFVWGANPAGWRLESIVWMLLGAVGWAGFTRRFLLPWTGSDHARIAGLVSGLLVVVHPLSVASVGALAARGELLGFCALAWSGSAFLRGRQDRRFVFTAAAVCLGIVGALASESLLLLPLLVLTAEIISAHRYRPWTGRIRTGVTTALVFSAGVALGRFGSRAARSAAASLEDRAGAAFGHLGQLDDALATHGFAALDRLGILGRLVLPVDSDALGPLGLIAAGGLFLVAVQPAATAARSAPRLWGWLLFGWVAAMLAGVTAAARSWSLDAGFDLAWNFLPAIGFTCFGLAASVTAVSGFLRRVLAAVLLLGYAGLSIGSAQAFREAGEATQALLSSVVAEHRAGVPLWVVEPPTKVLGVRATGTSLRWLGNRLGLSGDELRGVRHSDLAQALRSVPTAHRIDLLVREPNAVAAWDLIEGREWQAPSVGPSWRNEFRSPDLELDPRAFAQLRIRVLADERVDDLGPMAWSARGGWSDSGTCVVRWWREGGELHGLVELGGKLEWLAAGRVRRVYFPEGRGRLLEAAFER